MTYEEIAKLLELLREYMKAEYQVLKEPHAFDVVEQEIEEHILYLQA